MCTAFGILVGFAGTISILSVILSLHNFWADRATRTEETKG
jgi:hypothetical protein